MKKSSKTKKALTFTVQPITITLILGFLIVASLITVLVLNSRDIQKLEGKISDLNNSLSQYADLASKPSGASSSALPSTGKTTIANGAVKGDKSKAKVAIVEFSDFECPFCKRHDQQVLPELLKNYVDTGKAIYVYRHNPLSFHEPNATEQANAAECVRAQLGDQGFWKFHDLVFETTTSNKGLAKDRLPGLAQQVGADVSKFNTCFDQNSYKEQINKDSQAAAQATLSGTPGFVVGAYNANTGEVSGDLIRGAYPYDTFKTALDKYLK